MTEKELKKLNRYQLLELLVAQTERSEMLQEMLDSAEKQLKEQSVNFYKLGSIAEASLQLKGVFQAAQDAADMYVDAAKKHAEEIESEALNRAAEILARAAEEANRIKGE